MSLEFRELSGAEASKRAAGMWRFRLPPMNLFYNATSSLPIHIDFLSRNSSLIRLSLREKNSKTCHVTYCQRNGAPFESSVQACMCSVRGTCMCVIAETKKDSSTFIPQKHTKHYHGHT